MDCIVFCAEASESGGLGHLMRCMAVAQAAQDKSIKSLFFVKKYASERAAKRKDWVGDIIECESERVALRQLLLLRKTHSHLVVVLDGYCFSSGFAKSLAENAVLVVLDDVFGVTIEFAHIIVNPAGENRAERYNAINPNALLCLGAQYRLLRREFVEAVPLRFSKREQLVINMGGSDPKGYTLPILQHICCVLPKAPITVITGSGYQHLSELECFVRENRHTIRLIHNSDKMAREWECARLAIAAAGGSQFELTACYSPALLVVVADNQLAAAKQAESLGWCECIDGREQLDLETLANNVKALWKNTVQLESMHLRAKQNAFRNGAQLLVTTIARTLEVANS